jgi:hypothetical protein
MQKPCPCSVCQSPEHHSRKCPELHKDLETGFYKPAGGMPQGGGDDDDEKLNILWQQLRATWVAMPSSTQTLNTNSVLLFSHQKI